MVDGNCYRKAGVLYGLCPLNLDIQYQSRRIFRSSILIIRHFHVFGFFIGGERGERLAYINRSLTRRLHCPAVYLSRNCPHSRSRSWPVCEPINRESHHRAVRAVVRPGKAFRLQVHRAEWKIRRYANRQNSLVPGSDLGCGFGNDRGSARATNCDRPSAIRSHAAQAWPQAPFSKSTPPSRHLVISEGQSNSVPSHLATKNANQPNPKPNTRLARFARNRIGSDHLPGDWLAQWSNQILAYCIRLSCLIM